MTEQQMLDRIKDVDITAVITAVEPFLPAGESLRDMLPLGAPIEQNRFELVMACVRRGLADRLAEALEHAPPAEPAWVQALREARPRIVAAAHGARGTASFCDAAEALQSIDRAIAKFVDGE